MPLTHDLRYALRLLTRSRLSTILAILSLALGIGATTAIFSVVYAVLIDPYPYTAADRIGFAHILTAKDDDRGDPPYTMPEFQEIKASSKSIEDMILADRDSVVLTEQGLPEAVTQESFSPNAFEFFGVPPLFGRTFSPKDAGDESKVEDVAVLSYVFWQRHFFGRRDILGQSIRLNDKFYTIIGVLPIRFTWQDADVYTPIAIRPDVDRRYGAVMRVRPGLPRDQIDAELQAFHTKFAKAAPSFIYPDPPFRTKFESVNESILGKFANTLMALLAAVGFLLLIACANVANLLLARASARRGEIAVRAAMGAGTKRIVQQLLTESVILSVTGGALGVLLAYGGIKAVVALLPEYSIPHEAVISLNLYVLAFAVTVSVFTGILFGLAPAFQLASQNQSAFLRDAGRDSAAGSAGNRLRNILIISEVALSLVLLTGAALAGFGLIELTRQKLGYEPKGVLTTYVPMPQTRYPQWSQRRAFYNSVIERLRAIPSVTSVTASITGVPPYGGADFKFNMAGLKAPVPIRTNLVGDAYLSTMRIPLLKGRFFDADDLARPNPVVVVSEDMVKTYFPEGQDPLGRQISIDIPVKELPKDIVYPPNLVTSYQIIGVTASARNRGVKDSPLPAIYIPFTDLFPAGMMLAVRTSNPNPRSIENAVRQAVSAVDPVQPLAFVRTGEDFLGYEMAYPKFATFLFGIFGVIGIALASIGIFGVVSYSVSRRTREFGIRMALGATPANVLRLVITSMGRVLIIGFVIGTILSIISTRALADKLEGIGATNPLALLIVIAVLAIAALLACTLPARTATQIHPVEALRHE
jgi:putative ABC transport system permease protein